MKPLRIFVCEDEVISLKMNGLVLEEHLKEKNIVADITYRHNYDEHDERILKKTELAILDIDLEGSNINGIELAKKIQKMNPNAVFIFVTAHEEFAYEAAHIHLSGFLGKPLNQYDFQDSLDRAIIQINGYRIKQLNNYVATFQDGKIMLRERSIISIVKVTKSHEVEVLTTERKIRVYDSIRYVEKRLSHNFVKLNRSVIVNLSYIFNIENNVVVMRGGTLYEISTRNQKKVREAYEGYISRRLV